MRSKKNMIMIFFLILTMLMTTAFVMDDRVGNRQTVFENLIIKEGTALTGNAASVFGDITIDGHVYGNAAAVFGDITINGTVDGSVVSVFGHITVNSHAVINGGASSVFGGVDKASDAIISGSARNSDNLEMHRDAPKPRRHQAPKKDFTFASIVGLIISYAFAALTFHIAPHRVMIMAEESFEHIGRRFGIGFLAGIALVPVMVILAITIVGLLAIPFIVGALMIASFVGMVALKIAIGQKIVGHLEGKNAIYTYLLVGLLIVYVVKILPILGPLAYFVLSVFGIGIAIDTRAGSPVYKR